MTEDLSLTGNRYAWLLTVFYIGYILFAFLAIMWKVMPPHLWACIIVLAWGLIATLQAATMTWAGEMACRFFLGAAEQGFGPGCPYLLSFFYLRHELGLRVGIFLSAAPLANMFSGALAYGITSGHSRLANWRLLFLVEGLPTILMSAVAFIYLPDSPDKARFLNEEERLIAKARGVRQAGTADRVGGVVWKDVAAALLDLKCWFTAVRFAVRSSSLTSNEISVHVLQHQCFLQLIASLFAGMFLIDPPSLLLSNRNLFDDRQSSMKWASLQSMPKALQLRLTLSPSWLPSALPM